MDTLINIEPELRQEFHSMESPMKGDAKIISPRQETSIESSSVQCTPTLNQRSPQVEFVSVSSHEPLSVSVGDKLECLKALSDRDIAHILRGLEGRGHSKGSTGKARRNKPKRKPNSKKKSQKTLSHHIIKYTSVKT